MNLLLALLLVAADPPSVGQRVMPKEGAVLQVGAKKIEDDRKYYLPYIVRQVRSPWLLVGERDAGWIKQNDVLSLAEAPNYYSALIESRPRECLYRMRGVAWNNLGEYDKAIADLTEAIRLDAHEVCFFHRGEAWRMKQDFDRAIDDYTEAVRRDPQLALAYASRGLAWRAKGEFDRALADDDEAIRLMPNFARAYGHRAGVWIVKGDLDRAIADYGEALRHQPNYAIAFAGRGHAWRKKGELDRALDDYDQAIVINPAHAPSWIDQGTLLCEKGDFDAGIASLSEAIKLDPRDFRPLKYRGYAWMRKGDFVRATADHEQALQLAPKESLNAAVFAWLLATCPDVSLRNGRRALELATQACELTEFRVAPCVEALAAANAELGNFEAAVRWQEKALDLDKSQKQLKDAEPRLRLYQDKKPYRE